MKKVWRRAAVQAVVVVMLLLLYAFLHAWMDRTDAAAAILALGPHVPWPTLAGAGAFLLSRIVVLVVVPGSVLLFVLDTVWAVVRERRAARAADGG